MATPDLYVIDGEKLQLKAVVERCEAIARKNRKAYFVGRETIRGRLRSGVRTWEGLTRRVTPPGATGSAWRKDAPQRHAGDSLYEPEDYVGPDESLDELLKGY